MFQVGTMRTVLDMSQIWFSVINKKNYEIKYFCVVKNRKSGIPESYSDAHESYSDALESYSDAPESYSDTPELYNDILNRTATS